MSFSARTGSLALPVAKAQSGAEGPTVSLPLCRTIALHRPSHECNQIAFSRYKVQYVHKAKAQRKKTKKVICTERSSQLLHKWRLMSTNTHVRMCAHSLEIKVQEHVHSSSTSIYMHPYMLPFLLFILLLQFFQPVSLSQRHSNTQYALNSTQ